jgi:hypothetical protein
VGIEQYLVGEDCWYVSAGGATAPSFRLVMGEKIPLVQPLKNPNVPESFRFNRGSVELLVWCSWRLQTPSSVLATSDQGPGWVEQLQGLIGQSVTGVVCSPPAWDLRISFADGTELLVFCDHADDESSIAQNWELYLPERVIRTGPGSAWEETTEPEIEEGSPGETKSDDDE